MTTGKKQSKPRPAEPVLVLQGGGALGSYQAGVYEALAAEGVTPQWVAGISIGAINAAIIAGNPPERRVERLRDFWRLVSAGPQANALIDAGRGTGGGQPDQRRGRGHVRRPGILHAKVSAAAVRHRRRWRRELL